MGASLSRTPSSTYWIRDSGTGISSLHTDLSVIVTGSQWVSCSTVLVELAVLRDSVKELAQSADVVIMDSQLPCFQRPTLSAAQAMQSPRGPASNRQQPTSRYDWFSGGLSQPRQSPTPHFTFIPQHSTKAGRALEPTDTVCLSQPPLCGSVPTAPMDSHADRTTPVAPRSAARSFLSHSFSLQGKKSENLEPKGPLGLTTLYVPGPEQTVAADLVFVHGLNGGSFSTWSKESDPGCYWPREWLPMEDGFGDVRIHAFGYPAAATRESVLNIRDIARSLLAAVQDSPLMNQGNQVRH